MSRPVRLTAIALLSAGLVAGLAVWWHGFGAAPALANAPAQTLPQPLPTVVAARPILREIVEQRDFPGRFEPSAAVEIRARVTGHLETLAFRDGEIVQKGQVLFTIDPRPYKATLDEARAQLASADAQVELAGLELNRAEQLVSSNATSQATLDQRRQQKKAADAARALAAASVSRAEINVGFTEVRAPFTGRISNRRLDIGALVTEGAMLTTLVALDPVYFVFDISEQDMLAYEDAARSGALPMLHGSQIQAEARAQDSEGWPHKGVIDFVDNRLEAGAGTIRARARIANADQSLTPGQFGRVRLAFTGRYQAILVPETALMTDQAGRAVLVVSPDNSLRSAKVQLGTAVPGGLRVVRSGLAPEDRVVVSGLLRARPGQKVTVQPADGEARAAGLATPAGR